MVGSTTGKIKMNKLLAQVDGKKTFFGGGLIFVVGGIQALETINIDLIPDDLEQALLLAGAGIATVGFRHAINKIFKN